MRQTGINKYHVVSLVIAWAVIHGILFWHFGIRTLYDSADYVKHAAFLIEHGKFEDTDQLFYAMPILFIAFSRWLFAQQLLPFLIFQIALSGIAVLALYRSAEKVFNNAWAGFLSGIIFLVWWDNIHWNITVMTESFFCSFTCFIVYLLVHFKGSRREHYIIFAFLTIIFFARPTGIIITLGVIAFLLHYHWRFLAANAVRKVSLIAGLLLMAYFSASLMFIQWDFTEQYRKGNIVTHMDTIEGSTLYEESLRLNTNDLEFAPDNSPAVVKIVYFIINNPRHFLMTASLKVWYLVSGIRPYYSTVHNSFTLVWMTAVYFFCYNGWRNSSAALINTFNLTVIVADCGLIAISTVDWDNRFYIPMEPSIVLLAGGGAMTLIELLKKKIAESS